MFLLAVGGTFDVAFLLLLNDYSVEFAVFMGLKNFFQK